MAYARFGTILCPTNVLQRINSFAHSPYVSTLICKASSSTAAWAVAAHTPLRDLERNLSRPLGVHTKQQLLRLSDLRTPHEWYPTARRMRRKIVLHVGPTNSGKTHAALNRLRGSRNGMYCGPLRLLAWEIHERLNDSGTPCDLVTGQERDYRANSRHVSCTVEMADVWRPMEVVVLDEIQMLGDENRGWAWTRVLLGSAAEEVHCCGDAAAVPLVQALMQLTADELVIHTYSRLSPLQVSEAHVRNISDLRRGDVVVAFSRKKLYEWKRHIESSAGLRVGLIYGALPPAVRREQAKRFNAGASEGSDSYSNSSVDADLGPPTDLLCASDAVGMGLNLAIGRVVFTDVQKFDGSSLRKLTVSELKQIGGRAGRFGSRYPSGSVTGMSKQHQGVIRQALGATTPILPTAYLQPTMEHVEAFTASLAPSVLPEDLLRQLSILAGSDSGSSSDESTESDGEREGFSSDGESIEYKLQESSSDCYVSDSSDSDDDSDSPSSSSSASDSELDTAIFAGRLTSSMDANGYTVPRHVSLLADAVTEIVPFSRILRAFASCATTEARKVDLLALTQGTEQDQEPLFKIAGSLSGDMMEAARLMDDVALPFRHRWAFCQAPVDTGDTLVVQALRRYATRFVERGKVRVGLKVPPHPPTCPRELEELESAHAVFDLYTWLARKFPTEFVSLETAQAAAITTQGLISEGLERIGAQAVAEGQSRRAEEEERQKLADVRALRKAVRKAGKRMGRKLALDQLSQLDRDDLMSSAYMKSMVESEQVEEPPRWATRRSSHSSGARSSRGGGAHGVRDSLTKTRPFSVKEQVYAEPWTDKESSRSRKKQIEDRRAEKKSDRKRLRQARRRAEGMMFDAAQSGTLKHLKEDPTYVELMDEITSKGKVKKSGATGWGRGWQGRSGKGVLDQPLTF